MTVPQSVIEACKRGDARAFEELVRLTHRDVYSLALRLTGNAEDAADVAQETFIKMVRSIGSFRGDAKFSTWLYRVTANAAITSLRRSAARRLDAPMEAEDWERLPAPVSDDPAIHLERRELRDRLDKALGALPPGYRTVVVMKDVYGLSLAEVGRHLNISEGAAKVRLFRARQKLREMLHGNDAEASVGR
ncbi:MAG: RNA polymerase sigma factor [Actinomycetota bacterium]